MIAALRALRRRIVIRTVLHAYARNLVTSQPPLPCPDVLVRLAAASDLPALATTIGPDRARIHDFKGAGDLATVLEERHRRGHLCILAETAAGIVASCWARFDDASLKDFGIEAPLEPAHAYLYGAYTLSEYRGRRLMGSVVAQMQEQLCQRRVRAAFAWVGSTNGTGAAVLRREGWRVVGQVVRLDWRLPRPVGLVGAAFYDPADPLAVSLFRRLAVHDTLMALDRGRRKQRAKSVKYD